MKLKDPKIKIVTVSSSATKRQLVNTYLRAQSYEDVSGAPDLKTVLDLLDHEVIHWLICPLEKDSEVNALQLMQFIVENPKAMDMRISLMISEDDLDYMGKAFDLGMLSYHTNLEAKTDVEEAFSELMEVAETNEWRQDLIAAHYLRRYLNATDRKSELHIFEKKLLSLNPGQAHLLLAVGETYCLQGNKEKGESLFRQALLINPNLAEKIEAMGSQHGLKVDADEKSSEQWNVLGIDRCLVLDPDDNDRQTIIEFLEKLGVSQISSYSTCTEALKIIEEGKEQFELIIFEWGFPDMSGPILAQKLRDLLGYSIPLTVINKDLREADMPILKEMGVTDRIKKPLHEGAFCKDLVWIINQDRSPTDPYMIYQKLIYAIKDHNQEQVASLKQKYQASPGVREEDIYFIEGLIAFHSGLYLAAKESALNCLKSGGDSLDALNLLGKSMMKLREFDAAVRCLENADVISPANIERICKIAEAHMEAGRSDEAHSALEQAKNLDSQQTPVRAMEAKSALREGNPDTAKGIMATLRSLEDIVSYTNNRAVSLIRTDSFDEGIRLYQDAIKSLPTEREKICSIVVYNLALAHIRAGNLDEAMKVLSSAKKPSDKKATMSKKIGNIRQRLKKSIDSGEDFALKPVQDLGLDDETSKLEELSRQSEELLKNLKVAPGDICCHKIYVEKIDFEGASKLLESKISLKGKKSRPAS